MEEDKARAKEARRAKRANNLGAKSLKPKNPDDGTSPRGMLLQPHAINGNYSSNSGMLGLHIITSSNEEDHWAQIPKGLTWSQFFMVICAACHCSQTDIDIVRVNVPNRHNAELNEYVLEGGSKGYKELQDHFAKMFESGDPDELVFVLVVLQKLGADVMSG